MIKDIICLIVVSIVCIIQTVCVGRYVKISFELLKAEQERNKKGDIFYCNYSKENKLEQKRFSFHHWQFFLLVVALVPSVTIDRIKNGETAWNIILSLGIILLVLSICLCCLYFKLKNKLVGKSIVTKPNFNLREAEAVFSQVLLTLLPYFCFIHSLIELIFF